jgi:hypothetical protein
MMPETSLPQCQPFWVVQPCDCSCRTASVPTSLPSSSKSIACGSGVVEGSSVRSRLPSHYVHPVSAACMRYPGVEAQEPWSRSYGAIVRQEGTELRRGDFGGILLLVRLLTPTHKRH